VKHPADEAGCFFAEGGEKDYALRRNGEHRMRFIKGVRGNAKGLDMKALREIVAILFVCMSIISSGVRAQQQTATDAVLALNGIEEVFDVVQIGSSLSMTIDLNRADNFQMVADALLAVSLNAEPQLSQVAITFQSAGHRAGQYIWTAESGEWDINMADVPTAPIGSNLATLSFNSDELGLQPVIGPLQIPSGIYILTATTEQFIIVEMQALRGECTSAGFGSLFNVSSGRASDGAETLLISDDCEALFSVGNTRAPWTLEFARLSNESVELPNVPFTSASEGLLAVIEPITFDDGLYRVTVTTEGYMIVRVVELSGTCDTGFGSLFNLSAGQAAQGAQATLTTTACTALIIIENATEPWTLEFENLR